MSSARAQLHGPWLHIAVAIAAGYDTAETVAQATRDNRPHQGTGRALMMMEHHGLIEREADRYTLTDLCRLEMPEPPPAS